jgi:hypothetical protein
MKQLVAVKKFGSVQAGHIYGIGAFVSVDADGGLGGDGDDTLLARPLGDALYGEGGDDTLLGGGWLCFAPAKHGFRPLVPLRLVLPGHMIAMS